VHKQKPNEELDYLREMTDESPHENISIETRRIAAVANGTVALP
jgi:hypothetical protein